MLYNVAPPMSHVIASLLTVSAARSRREGGEARGCRGFWL
jgi:hypothetical protein